MDAAASDAAMPDAAPDAALDEHGCVTDVQGLNLSGDLGDSYRDCLVAELSPLCSRCEQTVAGRVYYSCTVL